MVFEKSSGKKLVNYNIDNIDSMIYLKKKIKRKNRDDFKGIQRTSNRKVL